MRVLFPHLEGLQIEEIRAAGSVVRIEAVAGEEPVACSGCGTLSGRVHSRYRRQLSDTSISGREVVIVLRVRRLFCGNSYCSKTTFARCTGFSDPAYFARLFNRQHRLPPRRWRNQPGQTCWPTAASDCRPGIRGPRWSVRDHRCASEGALTASAIRTASRVGATSWVRMMAARLDGRVATPAVGCQRLRRHYQLWRHDLPRRRPWRDRPLLEGAQAPSPVDVARVHDAADAVGDDQAFRVVGRHPDRYGIEFSTAEPGRPWAATRSILAIRPCGLR